MDKSYGILILCAVILVLSFVGTTSARSWYVDGDGGADFTGIQDAINSAKDGDTILVYSGIYYEAVVVDKSVTLKGIGHPIVDACGQGSPITLTANGITLEGFTARNSSDLMFDAGIKVTSDNNIITSNSAINNNEDGIFFYSSRNNIITGNYVSNNPHYGIDVDEFSINNTFTGNEFINNSYGIKLDSCHNIVTGNNVSSSTYSGIGLSSSSNTLANNYVCNNNHYGIHIINSYSSSNVLTNNTITNNTASNNNCGIRLMSSSGNTISNNNVNWNKYTGIELVDSCNNNIVTGNNVSYNKRGIDLSSSSNNNTLDRNTACNNIRSICLKSSCGNIVTGNNASNNNWYGIELYSSSDNNTITGNIATNNSKDGIHLMYSNNNSISNNNCLNNDNGIILMYSSNNNTLVKNVANNNQYGIIIEFHDIAYCSSNILYLNNLVYNTYYDAYDGSGPNLWDNGTIGNHYGNYDTPGEGCSDTDNNGICDSAYNIPGGSSVDRYPQALGVTTPTTHTVCPSGCDHTSIQAAIIAANHGDTIEVHSGTYEKVNVSKQLTLRGVDTGGGKPVVDAGGSSSAITLSVDAITLEGFTATNSGSSTEDAGILVISNNNNIRGNNASSNYYHGIYLYSSRGNTITNNRVCLNAELGISLHSSCGNTITNNIAQENECDFIIFAASDEGCNNIVENNTGSGDRPIKYFNRSVYLENEILSELILCNADNSTIDSVKIEGSATKKNNLLQVIRTDNSYFTNIDSSNNLMGIFFVSSSGNTLTNSIVCSNNLFGINLGSSSSNTIYNNFFNNTKNVEFLGTIYSNDWNTTKTFGKNIFGDPYLGGNFWANPGGTGFCDKCMDADNDGICDSAHTLVAGNVDYLPLSPTFDYRPPDVSIISPANGSNVFGIVTISVSASDSGVGVWWIHFYVDGILKEIDDSLPYNYSWDTSCEEYQTQHNITVVAFDLSGNKASDSVQVTVDDLTPPDVEILLPAEGELTSGLGHIELVVKAEDESGLSLVKAKIDDGEWHNMEFHSGNFYYYPKIDGTCYMEPRGATNVHHVWIPTGFSAGAHTIFVDAYDASANENKGTASRDFIYDAAPPIIHSITPANNSIVNGTVPITVNADDENGICNVVFWAGYTCTPEGYCYGGKRTTLSEPPYTYLWDTHEFPEGDTDIQIVVTDNSARCVMREITLNISNMNKPIVELISPKAKGLTYASDSLNITVNASDPDGSIEKVEYKINTGNWDEFPLTTEGLYKTTVDLSSLSEIKKLVEVRATDNDGLSRSEYFFVAIDRTEPTINIVIPKNNEIVYDFSNIFAEVDDSNLNNVSFYVDNVDLCTFDFDASNICWNDNCYYDTHDFSNGIHTVNVKAEDAAGNSEMKEVSIEIRNPKITINSVEVGGPYKLYTIDENTVNINASVTNEGVVDDMVLVKLEDLPQKYMRIVNIPAGESITVPLEIKLTEWIHGEFVEYGFTPGDQSFTVNVTSLSGESHDTNSSSFVINKGPVFKVTNYYITATGDGDSDVESNEAFNFRFTLENIGDETVDVTKFYAGHSENVYYCMFGKPTKNNFAPGDTWTINSDEIFSVIFGGSKYTTNIGYNFVGDAEIGLRLKYEKAGKEYITYFIEPITIPVSSFEKRFSGKTNKSRDMEVKTKGVLGDKVLIDLKNIGKVYYNYQAKGCYGDWEPSYDRTDLKDWDKIKAFIPPGGTKKMNIPNAKDGNDYKFETYFQYSIVHNELNGLLIAISAYPGMPPIDILIDILLDAAYESGVPVESITDFTILSTILEDEKFQKKMIELAGKYGYEIGEETLEKSISDFTTGVSFVKSVWGVANWVVDNIDPDTINPIHLYINITDPPSTYTVEFESEERELYFGGFSNQSTFGSANVMIALYENGTGSYNANYSTRTEYTDFNKDIFNYISNYEVIEHGDLKNNSLYGNVTIRFYPLRESAINLSNYLMRDDFATYLLQPYFSEFDKVEKRFKNNFIEINGTGILSSLNPDERVHSFTRIGEELLTSEFYSFGNYAHEEDGVILFNASFGPRFNIPLSRTKLTVSLPYENNTITPLPDNITNRKASWNQTPPHVKIVTINNNASTSQWVVRPITLDPITPLDDYQVKVELATSNFDYSNANTDGSDIRFYDVECNKLNYWVDEWNTIGTSTIWVKVPTQGTSKIYMHHGNPLATSESNGDNTFVFFDDFDGSELDTNKWSETYNYPAWTVSDSILALRTSDSTPQWAEAGIKAPEDFAHDFRVMAKVKGNYNNADLRFYCMLKNLNKSGYYLGFKIAYWGTIVYAYTSNSGDVSLFNYPTDNSWVKFMITKVSTTSKFYWDNFGTPVYQEFDSGGETYNHTRIGTTWQKQNVYCDYIFITKFADLEPVATIGLQ